MGALIPASAVLQRLGDDAPADHFTLGWLMDRLEGRSFGIVMLMLALIAMLPGVSTVASLLLVIPAFQMIAGRPGPVFPHRVAAHRFATRHLTALLRWSVPALRYLETMIRPRWPTPIQPTKRLVGMVIMLLNVALFLVPIPLSNAAFGLVIALVSLAYLEEDGVLLLIALVAAGVVMAAVVAASWQIVLGAKWIGSLW